MGVPHLVSYRHTARDVFPSLTMTPPISGVERRRKRPKQSEFFTEYRETLRITPQTSNLSCFRKTLYRELVECVASDPLCEVAQLVGHRAVLFLVLSASDELSQQPCERNISQ